VTAREAVITAITVNAPVVKANKVAAAEAGRRPLRQVT
jgi:hypothetical protein